MSPGGLIDGRTQIKHLATATLNDEAQVQQLIFETKEIGEVAVLEHTSSEDK
jgi:hypothetical protein